VEKNLAVYCEKPLTSDIEDARNLVTITEKKNSITHTAFTYRYIRAVRIAKEILASGSLGEIHHFHSRFFHSSYLDPNRPISWRLEQSVAGGGALTDLGIHFLDIIRYLLGDVNWLQCQTRTFIQSRPTAQGRTQPVDVDDWALCTLGMQTGGIGSLEVSRVSGGAGNTALMEIYGSRGSLKIDLDKGDQVQYFDAAKDQWTSITSSFESTHRGYYDPALWPDGKQSLGRFMDAHTACIVDFLQCVHNKEESTVNFRQALAAQELLHACYRSASQNGEKVSIHD
jgi:predicted dehydrogenase